MNIKYMFDGKLMSHISFQIMHSIKHEQIIQGK